MDHNIPRLLALGLALLPLGSAPAQPTDQERRGTLVLKTPVAMVHLLASPNPYRYSQPFDGRHLLLTNRENGEMADVLFTGTWSDYKRLATYTQVRLLAVAADDQRLYVLVATVEQLGQRPRPPAESISLASAEKQAGARRELSARFSLRVYSLKSGERLLLRELTGAGRPDVVPAEGATTGSLNLVKDGVEVYGVKVTFDDKNKVKE